MRSHSIAALIAAVTAATTLAAGVPSTAFAAPRPSGSLDAAPALSKTKVSDRISSLKASSTQAFIETTSPAAIESGSATASATQARAARSKAVSDSVGTALKKLDPSARIQYTTSYALSGLAVNASPQALSKLAENSAVSSKIQRVVPLPQLTTTDAGSTTDTATVTEQQKQAEQRENATKTGEPGVLTPANKNSDRLAGAVKAWQQTHRTGEGVNVAIVDTGLDYTHADFGGKGTTAAYDLALSAAKQSVDPLTDPQLSSLLDRSKYKGGWDFAGTTYGSRVNGQVVSTPTPDPNPIDGAGGHHGTHVAGTSLGYGVNADGSTFTGDYSKLTNAEVSDMLVGPGTAPKAGVYALKVFGDNGGSTGLAVQALDWVARHNTTASAADRIDIVSMSLGGSYGAPDDPENEAVDNLTRQGVLSVIAAGNDGDVTDILGNPGGAKSALTVAASNSGKTVQDAARVVSGGSLHGRLLAGQYSQDYADLDNFDVTGKVVKLTDQNNLTGCAAYSQADKDAVRGNIAWIEWDDDNVVCGSGQRFTMAQQAGAIGVVFASQSDLPSAGIAGNAGIPGIQLVKSSVDDAFTQALDSGTLELELASSLRHAREVDYSKQYEDTVADFTSRGLHGSYDGTVKPDVSAPGVGIISASAGTGTQFEVMSGTSMATPFTSGVTALVRQAHPDWSAEQVKAQVINTADHDILTADRGQAISPLRAGTGRIDALAAVNNGVQVSSDDTLAVTGQFGVVRVPQNGYSATKTFTVTNTTAQTRSYTLEYRPRTQVPGVSYRLSTDRISVGPRQKKTFTVTLTAVQSQLRRSRDASESAQVHGQHRSYVTDASGVIRLQPTDNASVADQYGLRVVVSSAPKALSETDAHFNSVGGGNDRSAALSITGHGCDQGSGDEREASRAVPLVLSNLDGTNAYTGDLDSNGQRSLAAADIRAVGYGSTAGQHGDPSKGTVYFGIETDKSWNNLSGSGVMFDLFLQTADDKVFETTVESSSGNTQYDTAFASTYDITGNEPVQVDREPIDDAFQHDSNQLVLSIKLSALGVRADTQSLPLLFFVRTYSEFSSNQGHRVDTVGLNGNQFLPSNVFDALDPDLSFGARAGQAGQARTTSAEGQRAAASDEDQIFFPDDQGSTIPVTLGGSADAANVRTLTLHTHGRQADTTSDQPVIDYDNLTAVDKAVLRADIRRFSGLTQSEYTADSWKAFQQALERARQTLADPNATQAQVAEADKDLRLAYDTLVFATPAVNKDQLRAAVESGGKLASSGYTSQSWATFAQALERARQVLADPNATQEQVDEALNALNTARDALVRAEHGGTGTPSTPAQPATPGQGGGDKRSPASSARPSAAVRSAGRFVELGRTGSAVTAVVILSAALLATGVLLVGSRLARRRHRSGSSSQD